MSEKNTETGDQALPIKSEFLLYQTEDGKRVSRSVFRMKLSG